jgi:hypothetical protein
MLDKSDTNADILVSTIDPELLRRYVDRYCLGLMPSSSKAGRESGLPVDWDQVDRCSSLAVRFFHELNNFLM